MRARLLTAVGLATVVAVTACGGGGASSEGGVTTIDITVTHPEDIYSLPWVAAMDQGFFERRGVKVGRIVPGEGGGTTLRNLLQGGLAVGDVAYPAVAKGYAAGAPIKVVGGALQSLYNVQFYALASNDRVNSIEDVRTWAFTNPGSVTESLSYLIPEVADLQGQQIKRVASGGTGEGIALLEAGKVDIAVVPPATYLENPDKFKLIVDTTEYLPAFQQTVIVTSPDFVESDPDVVKGVLAGYQEAVAWIKENPDEATKLFMEQSEMPEDIAGQVVEGAIEADSWGVAFNPEAVEAATQALQATDFEEEVPYCELFTDEFLPAEAKGSLPAGGCG